MDIPPLKPADTSPEAFRVYLETLERLGPGGRMELGAKLSNGMRRRIVEGVRYRHPDYDDDQVRRAVLRLMVGEELFAECCPGDDIEP